MAKFLKFYLTGYQVITTRSAIFVEKWKCKIFGKILSLALSLGYAGPRFPRNSVCNLLICTKNLYVEQTIEDLADF